MHEDAAGATSVEIRLLGELQVERAGHALELPRSRRARALLAYLAASATPQRRELLCDLLWDGPDDPRAQLRWSLTKLRPLLDEPAATRLIADREHVALDSRYVSVDWHEVQALVGARPGSAPLDALRAAAGRFRGEFIAGLELADCYAFSAWVAAQRDATRALHRDVLGALVDGLRDDPAEALSFARRRVAIDPFAEDAYADVIELLGALGRVREARAEYDACRRLLKQELGRAPGALLEQARGRADRAPRLPARPSSHPPVESRPIPRASAARPAAPLAGRRAELDALTAWVRGARSERDADSPSIVLLTGEPGIGKSRLLEEVASLARRAGGVVLHGRAFEAEMVRPYGPWIDALRSLVRADPEWLADAIDPTVARELSAFVPELSGSLSRASADGALPGNGARDNARGAGASDRTRLFEAVTTLLSSLAERAPPVAIVLDELQWFDDSSAALLHFVARALLGDDRRVELASRTLIACSARPATLEANAATSSIVRALRRDGRLRELRLAPLATDEVVALVSGAHPAVDAARVAAASEGNPLFALEIARTLAEGRAGIPDTLEALIDDHLVHMTDRARETVTWAAALGGAFDVELLGHATGLSSTDLLTALEELERYQVIRAGPNETSYDFTHDLIRRVAYDRLSPARSRVVHAEIARRLAALDDPTGALAGDIAHHALMGGDADLAARACARAGERCIRLFALEEARALASRGLAALAAGVPIPERRRVELETVLLRVLVHAGGTQGRERDVQARLEAVSRSARVLGMHSQVQAAFYLISYIHYKGGDWDRAREDTLRAVEAGRSSDGETAVRAIANTGRCLASIERELPRAQQLLAEARARTGDDGPELVDLAWGTGILAHFSGDLDTAAAEFARAVELARREDEHWPACDCLVRLACLELERGRPDAAKAHCEELAPLAARLGDASEKPFGEAVAALAELSMAGERARADGGALERAPDSCEEAALQTSLDMALHALADADAKGARAYVLVAAAERDLAAGRIERARRRATEAEAAAEAVGRRSELALARLILARAALSRGDVGAAEQALALVAAEAERAFSLNARAARAYASVRASLAPPPVAVPHA